MKAIRPAALAGLLLLLFAVNTHGVVLTRTAARNTSAPTGTYAGSGWQYQFSWGQFLGTPIAPYHFITAKHVGGGVGQTFTYGGTLYSATAVSHNANADLSIWRVNKPFKTYAPLYTGTAESGKRMITHGRGSARGSTVYLNGQVKGWKEGNMDYYRSWGENMISRVVDGGAGFGHALEFDFTRTGGTYNEAMLTSGDSGGGLFIQDAGIWKLAGINYGVKGPFNTFGGGPGFRAALVDMGGLWESVGGQWQYRADVYADLPTAGYATRISSNMSWIRSIIGTPAPATSFSTLATVPEPGLAAMLLPALLLLKRGRRAGRN